MNRQQKSSTSFLLSFYIMYAVNISKHFDYLRRILQKVKGVFICIRN